MLPFLLLSGALAWVGHANCDDPDAFLNCDRKISMTQPFPKQVSLLGVSYVGNTSLVTSTLAAQITLGTQGLDVLIEYKFGGGRPPNTLAYNFRMVQLLEFKSANEVYDPSDGVDEIIAKYSFADPDKWAPWILSSYTYIQPYPLATATIWEFNSTTLDGQFTFRGRIPSRVVGNWPGFGDISTPNMIKFDVLMNGYNYSTTPDTSLALSSCVSSQTTLAQPWEIDHGELQVYPQIQTYVVGQVEWDGNIDVWLQSEPDVIRAENMVAAWGSDPHSGSCNTSDLAVFYSVESSLRLDRFVWDPFVGVYVFPPAPTDEPAPAPAKRSGTTAAVITVLVLLGIVGFCWWRRQHNKTERSYQSAGSVVNNEESDPMSTY